MHFRRLVENTVVGTVVRAPMLINCDLGPSFHICCNDVLADQHNGRYSWIPRLPTDLCYYSRIWKSYPGATLHVAFYFTLLSLCLCPGASLPVVVGRAKEKKKVTCTSRARELNPMPALRTYTCACIIGIYILYH